MAHRSENSRPLKITRIVMKEGSEQQNVLRDLNDVVAVILPSAQPSQSGHHLSDIETVGASVISSLGSRATLIVLGEIADLVHIHSSIGTRVNYQLWIAIKDSVTTQIGENFTLPRQHFGALVYTMYSGSLRHAKTRLQYTFCPACDKTTKDYGGKKHTYHEYGTLLSDVWRDLNCSLRGDLSDVVARFADLFGIEPYNDLRVLDYSQIKLRQSTFKYASSIPASLAAPATVVSNKLLLGDSLEQLKKLPDRSVDFAFADPPYNLRKHYTGYSDDLAITEYFQWCDQWLTEMARTLRSGRTLAILNIPLWTIRHFLHLEKILSFQNWIVWDALSYPVRMIMPAHYSIICFTKGEPRPLPGLARPSIAGEVISLQNRNPLRPLADRFCLRSHCMMKRISSHLDDSALLTDVWSDIHRLKHNSRRVDHPCQLPPQLMYRLISIFTKPGETVLDCFDGAGTTTLSAHQMGRKYIGIEKAPEYHRLTFSRHREIEEGTNPFRKVDRVLISKNSPVARLPKQKYIVSKKTLQLEVRRVATLLGKLPSREELRQHGSYPIEYYDKYFVSWGEVCAAARTTGMSEVRIHCEVKLGS